MQGARWRPANENMSSPESSAYDLFKLSGQRLEGRFRVDRAIAEGGFGVVYEGWHLGLDARVAIKVLKTPEGLAESVSGIITAVARSP